MWEHESDVTWRRTRPSRPPLSPLPAIASAAFGVRNGMPVDFSLENHVATVTLNRPLSMNAIAPETQLALREHWTRIREDDDIRVVILTGAGEKAFCTGADLKKTMP